VERWIAEDRPLQLEPEAILKGTRPKTGLQIALETGQHSLALLPLRSGSRLELEHSTDLHPAPLRRHHERVDNEQQVVTRRRDRRARRHRDIQQIK
jgi:hypothetical protein